jgi:hypothetical protein
MQGKWIYLGRLTVPAAPIATLSTPGVVVEDSAREERSVGLEEKQQVIHRSLLESALWRCGR